ncbi:DUF421 domain-containing protein [Taibaiella koreensis]|uniref:DUF421 domain-containing protein n=1 Tax=Taibaiella koreensis TaxID=1268548 RepID=UPI000E59E04E|nr:DUF421 domain-containing protein [Taibaiella koreensis]
MNGIEALWETDEQLGPLPMAVRALVMFLVALILLRIGGIRIFGQKSALDNVIVIMLGAVMARGVVGASTLQATFIAATIMILTNRILAWLSCKSEMVNKLIKGYPINLIEAGEIKWEAMKKANLSESDLKKAYAWKPGRKILRRWRRLFLRPMVGLVSF